MEVQIRTLSMHEQAEFGIATHIIYEQGKMRRGVSDKQVEKGFKANKEQLDWIKELTQWQKEEPDSDSFLIGLKHDLFKDRIFVYTPKGDVKDLPLGSTPIDFAYAIHSEVGDKTIGAKVDGHIVPLNYQLRSGEIIEILTTKDKKTPSPDWLRFVQTNVARKHIQKAANIPVIEKEDRWSESEEREPPTKSNENQGVPTGSLLTNPMSLVSRVQTVLKNRLKKKPVSSRAAIVVHGLDGVATKLAKCCNPLPGEEIIGFVTDEQHVSIHSATCHNVSNIMHKEKQIPVAWSLPPGLQKAVRMKVEMNYREGALRDITKVLADARVAIEQFEQLPTRDDLLKIQFVVGFNDDTQRSQLYSKLQRVTGVHTVE
jgi:GTP pyrophosphokinase